jgi:uncharacterized protein involved in exopolysaccharide biosynthesis
MPDTPIMNPAALAVPDDDEVSLLDLVQVGAENLRLLVLGPLLVAVAVYVACLFITPTFTANSTFVPPPQQQSAAAMVLQTLGPLAGVASAAGLGPNPADRYVAFTESRSVRDALIERFDLMTRYHTTSREAARAALGGRTKVAGGKNGLINVEVTDTDPKFAAQMANAYVEELSKLLGRLSLTEAQSRRAFFEQQLEKARKGLVNAEAALKSTGINESAVKASPGAAVGAVASLMAHIAAKEVEIGAMRGYLAESAPDYQKALVELRAMRSQLAQSDKSSSAVTSGSDYVAKFRDFKYYETLYELMARQFEVARLDESREGVIQVVDKALPPEHKSGPKKAQNAVIAAVVTGILLVMFVFVRQALRNSGRDPESASKLAAVRQSVRRAFGRR